MLELLEMVFGILEILLGIVETIYGLCTRKNRRKIPAAGGQAPDEDRNRRGIPGERA